NSGICNLRFDDTNPVGEDMHFVQQLKHDLSWMGFEWGDNEYFASDYFERLYQFAEELIRTGKAYVDSLSKDEISEYRGNFYKPGENSPYRDRSVEENLDLFRRMRAGEFKDEEQVLRAKIDMKSPNMNLRDPPIYRIRHATHYRKGDSWCIYPMYDFAHALSDAIEGVTHSLCSTEFENHRPLYDWFVANCTVPGTPRQIEFGRLNISYTLLSKRKLRQLVELGKVSGWDDPRMPTIAGMRRRGYTPEAILRFHKELGLSKNDGYADVSLLEFLLREDLNKRCPRVMGVLRPLRVVITNYPEDQVEEFEVPNSPEDPELGTRVIPFSREIYVERGDYLEDTPKKWYRLSPGRTVRLRYSYIITCDEAVKDPETGEVIELRCSYEPGSRGAAPKDGRKVRGTLHWVSIAHAVDAEIRLYDRLFSEPVPGDGDVDFKEHLNPNSLEVLSGCKLEPGLAEVEPGYRCQFERNGYFCADLDDHSKERPVFNQTIALRDSWAKIAKNQGGGAGAKKPSKNKNKNK
ncbi:MAG: glutamine--tRNA ligase/YqeY domain fusion protein, partial [Myxococcota bacterium]